MKIQITLLIGLILISCCEAFAQNVSNLNVINATQIPSNYGMPVKGSEINRIICFNGNSVSVLKRDSLINRLEIPSKRKNAQVSLRCLGRKGDGYIAFDYAFQRMIMLNDSLEVLWEKRFRRKFNGEDYDIWMMNPYSILDYQSKWLMYTSPIGDLKKNLYTSQSVYFSEGIIGVWEETKRNFKLKELFGKRDSVYAEYSYLPYLHYGQLEKFRWNGQEFLLIGQEASDEISILDSTGNEIRKFGEKGFAIEKDSLIEINWDSWTKRRMSFARLLSTSYGQIYYDRFREKVYRIYQPGGEMVIMEDSLKVQFQGSNGQLCVLDPFNDQIIGKELDVKRFLQIYAIGESEINLESEIELGNNRYILNSNEQGVLFFAVDENGKWIVNLIEIVKK